MYVTASLKTIVYVTVDSHEYYVTVIFRYCVLEVYSSVSITSIVYSAIPAAAVLFVANDTALAM